MSWELHWYSRIRVREARVADDPDGAYDLGLGAGFYLNATQEPWSRHYQMETFVVEELPTLLAGVEGLDLDRLSIVVIQWVATGP